MDGTPGGTGVKNINMVSILIGIERNQYLIMVSIRYRYHHDGKASVIVMSL